MAFSRSELFYAHCCNNRAAEVQQQLAALATDPMMSSFDPNWQNPSFFHCTPLHIAAIEGHVEVVRVLLAQPQVLVNPLDELDRTPLFLAAVVGHADVLHVLMDDDRCDVTIPDAQGRSAVFFAMYLRHLEALQTLLTSPNVTRQHVAGILASGTIDRDDRGEIFELAEALVRNEAGTRHALRLQVGIPRFLAARLFALVVLCCDEHLTLRPAEHPEGPAAQDARRFVAMAVRLPMELQMVLCWRTYGSPRSNIRWKDTLAGIREVLGDP